METAYADKNFQGKNLFKRMHGVKYAVGVGANNCIFTIPYNLINFIALELVGGEIGDTADLKVLDTVDGTYTGVPNKVMNQFAFNVNVVKDFHRRESKYPASGYIGLQMLIIYNSISAKTIGVNYDMDELKDPA